MRKLLAFSVLVLGLGAANATAGTITFDLNCQFDTPDDCTPSVSYGTVSLSDTATAGEFAITVDLVGPGTHKVQSLFLNFLLSVDDYVFSITGGVLKGQDSRKADGYSGGFFDLEIPSTGNLGFEPFIGTLVVTSVLAEGPLPTAMDFDTTDSQGLLFAAVHVGNIDSSFTPGMGGGDSIWVGSLGHATTPEPGLLLILGTGLLGASIAARRRGAHARRDRS